MSRGRGGQIRKTHTRYEKDQVHDVMTTDRLILNSRYLFVSSGNITRAVKISYQENLICCLNWQILSASLPSPNVLLNCFRNVDFT